VAPLEPSEAMAFSKEGIINAGLLLFAAATLATLVFGRFFCGWACHMVALQDACRWLMLRIGVRPMPLRSRLLRWVPLGAFLYMFLWPVVARWLAGAPQPGVRGVELTTNALWATFPGFWISAFGLFACGFLTVWFLGSKGLCVYGCPYGALFGAADAFAPGRIRVTDACEGCGHCTATCSSDVQVHAEVRDYGAVVDAGCLKCMDCVSVCPTNALYFGFGKPAAFLAPRREPPPASRPRNAPSWPEEVLAAAGFALAFFATRGLYGAVPFLVALTLGVLGGWAALMGFRLVRRASVRSGPWVLKRDGSMTRAGTRMAVVLLGMAGLLLHSAWVQVQDHAREQAFRETHGWRAAVLRDGWRPPDTEVRGHLHAAADAAERAAAAGLVRDDRNRYVAAWQLLADGDGAAFEGALDEILERRPGFGEILFQLGHFRRVSGDVAGAEAAWQSISARDARYLDAQLDLGLMRLAQGRGAEAQEVLDDLRERGFHAGEIAPLADAVELSRRG
jgi:NAD-dependent dihydropyrimidine dehydrogenase PreA subunit